MNVLLKWWKRIKGIRRIWISATIIITVVSAYLTFSRVLVHAGVRDPKDAGIGFELQDGSSAPSGDASDLMGWCEIIAKHYASSNPPYSYDQENGEWRLDYTQQTVHNSCCTIYAQQALFKANMLDGIDESNWENIWMSKDFGDWLDANPNWYKLKEGDKEEPGDVHVYYSDSISHTNIYAGDGQYWDAGEERGRSFCRNNKNTW